MLVRDRSTATATATATANFRVGALWGPAFGSAMRRAQLPEDDRSARAASDVVAQRSGGAAVDDLGWGRLVEAQEHGAVALIAKAVAEGRAKLLHQRGLAVEEHRRVLAHLAEPYGRAHPGLCRHVAGLAPLERLDDLDLGLLRGGEDRSSWLADTA